MKGNQIASANIAWSNLNAGKIETVELSTPFEHFDSVR